MENWNAKRSAELYRIADWGAGYFDINDKGQVIVKPNRNGQSCDLYALMRSLHQRGVEAPVLFRFDGIINDRTKLIQTAFQDAIDVWNYKGDYRVAFPLKVNPQGHVVETIRHSGFTKNIGLEVGSKPELLAVLAIHDLPDAPLLCNGYKDQEYIELALIGRKLGRRSIIIVEQLYELQQVLDAAKSLGVEAEIGIRIKPATQVSGLWSSSSGDQAKFGLTTQQVLAAIKLLEKEGKKDWLKLIHFHVGSQIPAINSLKRVLKEATRFYVEIAKLCPSLCMVDVGGGLGVDYDGSRTNFESSMNYSVSEYAEAIVSAICEACDKVNIPHPDILSESGRALVAHHAVLVVEVIDVMTGLPELESAPSEEIETEAVQKLVELSKELTVKNVTETLNEALSLREEIINGFVQGTTGLRERAYGENIFKHLISRLIQLSTQLKHVPEDLEKLEASLIDNLFCNFSLFQSMLDSWAIDQLFPIMPIQRLNEEPTGRAVIADLTCDSDGEISRFIDQKDVKNYMLYHPQKIDANEDPKNYTPYYLGIFLVGAYQEILGGLHNLFGDTNAVHVTVGEENVPELTQFVPGDTIRQVLEYVEFEPNGLVNKFRLSLERAIKNGTMTPEESAVFQRRYRDAMDGYTYLVK